MYCLKKIKKKSVIIRVVYDDLVIALIFYCSCYNLVPEDSGLVGDVVFVSSLQLWFS